jgi:hypothetical protein
MISGMRNTGVLLALAAVGGCGFIGSEEAERAAVEQYQARSGLHDVGVGRSKAWGDCAIVELTGIPGSLTDAVALLYRDGRWVLTRTRDDGDWWDTDDFLFASDCQAAAR